MKTLRVIAKGMFSGHADASKPLNLFDPSNAGGQNVSIKDDSLEANIIMNCMQNQFSFRKTTAFLNGFLVANNKRTVRVAAIFDCFHRMNPIMAKAGKRKQGSADVLANWSLSRYNWSGHWLARLNALTPEEIADYTRHYKGTSLPDFLSHDILKANNFDLSWEGMTHWDEMHMKVSL